MRLKSPKKLPLLLMGVTFLVLGALYQGLPLTFNKTESLPRGFYGLSTVKELSAGTLVYFPVLKRHRALPFLKDIDTLIKPVVAKEGRRYCMSKRGTRVGGVFFPLVSAKHLLERAGCFRVRRGNLLLLSAFNNRSFDSRYFGEISEQQILKTATPLLVWK